VSAPSGGGRGPALRLALLAGCFLLSGAASLMDQVVWLRFLSLVFGNTTWAAATLLAVFMGGLGTGALLGGRLTRRLARPLLAYAVCETAVALLAIASPRLIALIDDAYVVVYRAWGNQLWLFAGGRALLAGVFLLPPTLLMGATLPLVLAGAAPPEGRAGRTTGLLYGFNTLGAVVGTAVAGFVAIPWIGLRATLLLAAACNLIAALLALPLSRRGAAAGPVAAEPPQARERRWLLLLFFGMGATSLAYEVLWTRILVFYLGSSVYAYSLMLLLVLLGIAAGSLLAAPWADRIGSLLAALALVELALALWIPVQVLLFGRLNALLVWAGGVLHPTAFGGIALAQLLAVMPLLLPPTLLMGMSFPLAVRAIHRDAARLGADVGGVYGWNTLGAVLGSLLAGFLLIPALGTQNALLAVAACNALLAVLLARRRPALAGAASAAPRLLLSAAAAAPVLILAAALLLPRDRVILAAGMFRHDKPGDLVHFHEDAQASVTIRRLPSRRGPYLSLELNGVNVAGTSPDLYAIQKLQGHLPLLLAPQARSVVHIGFGSGGTAWAVSRHPVDDVTIVEISPAVLAASDRWFRAVNHGVLADPRVHVEINDGRNFLLASPRTVDAVLSDSIHPRYAGNGSLYSREYFRLLAARLRPGGVASMWLPMYSLLPRNYAMIVKAFADTFPHVQVWYDASTLNAFTIVTGSQAAAWSGEALARAFADPRVADELRDIGIARPADLLPLLVATERELQPWLATVPPHSDDLPAVEYESGALLHRDLPWLGTFTRLLALRPEEPPAAWLAALPASERAAALGAWHGRAALLDEHRRLLAAGISRELLGPPRAQSALPSPTLPPPRGLIPPLSPQPPAPQGAGSATARPAAQSP
jgi:spermidine synthase